MPHSPNPKRDIAMQLSKPSNGATKIDSALALRYLWLNFRLIGLYPTANYQLLYFLYALLTNFLSSFCFPLMLLLDLYYIESLDQLVATLSLTVTIVVVSFKHFYIFLYRKTLLDVVRHLRRLDERCNTHPSDRQHIAAAVRICHIFCVTYVFFYALCAYGFAYVGWSQHKLIYGSWIPRVLASADSSYYLAFGYQCIAQTFTIFLNTSCDCYPMCYVALMIGHLRALAARIERIGKDQMLSAEQNLQELLDCIHDHKCVLSYFESIRLVISRTIFLQFLITAFVLCLAAVNLITNDTDTTRLLFTAAYLVAILIEVFPCCWYVNLLVLESDYLTTAIYSCNWYGQNPAFRKTLIVFMQRSQKTNMILAGNMAPVTLQTFLAVIKFSFSMFTVLSPTEKVS